MRQVLCLLLVPAAFLGCESAMQPEAPVEGLRIQANGGKAVASVKGDGHYLLSGALDIKFQLNARVRADGSASGKFGQSLIFGGQLIKFQGTVTCASFDPVNGRAWIGGVVKNNKSEHPGFTTDIHEPGDDVWFRVLDTGDSAEPDRSTFLGFEGAGGIITSEEYCEAQIWPDDNARTHPVTEGSIKART